MASLFPNEDALASAMSAITPHVQFKAGIMSHDATTNLVTADPRKGMLQIVTSPEDSLTHLQWRPRPGNEIETDLIMFAGESEMKRVQSTSARVYVLKWTDASTRMFFWMQGGDESQDEPLIEQVNRILESGAQQHSSRIPSLPPQPPIPPPRLRIPEIPVPETTPTSAPIAAAATAGANPRATLTAPPAPPAAASGTTAAPATPLTLESFGRMLDALPSVANPDATRRAMLVQPTIQDLLRSTEFAEALQIPQVQEALPTLFEHLPEEERSVQAATELMRCPQVLTQAAALSRALNSGQGAALLRSLGLEEADGDDIGMKSLLDALKKVQRRD